MCFLFTFVESIPETQHPSFRYVRRNYCHTMTEALASRRQGCAWGVLRNTLTLEEWECLLVGIAEIDDYGGCRLRMPVPATETQL